MNESELLERIRDLIARSPVFVPQNQSSNTPAFPLTNGVLDPLSKSASSDSTRPATPTPRDTAHSRKEGSREEFLQFSTEKVIPTPPALSELSQDMGAKSGPLTKPSIQEETLPKPKAGVRARCRAWLEIRLNQGPVPLSAIRQEAKELGFSTKALRVTRRHLNVRPVACVTLASQEK